MLFQKYRLDSSHWRFTCSLVYPNHVIKNPDAGVRGIWTGLSRTLLHLSFQFLQKASWNSGIKLKADADLVSFNLTSDEIQWAKKAKSEKI